MAYQPTPEEKSTGMLCHLLAITFWLGPLIMFFVKKDGTPFVKLQIKQTLVWGIAATIAYAILATLFILINIGFLVSLLGLANAVFVVLAALKINKGEKFLYPLVAEKFCKPEIDAVYGS